MALRKLKSFPIIFRKKVTGGGSPPVNTLSPVITTPAPYVGQTLTASNGTWSNSPTSYAYQWRKDGANIVGATLSTYVIQIGDDAVLIDLVVTAINAFGNASKVSSNSLYALAVTLWLDASDASTITQVAGRVSQWNDKSGNGNNAVQATGAAQPLTGTRSQNGLNVIDFPGVAEFMRIGAGAYPVFAGNNTLLSVTTFDTMSTEYITYARDVGSGLSRFYYSGTTLASSNTAGGGASATVPETADATTCHLKYRRVNGTGVNGMSSGRDAVENFNGTAQFFTPTTLTIGAGTNSGGTAAFSFMDGPIAEYVLASRFWSNAETDQENARLKAKWATP